MSSEPIAYRWYGPAGDYRFTTDAATGLITSEESLMFTTEDKRELLRQCLQLSSQSHDPSTKIGAILTRFDRPIGRGVNGIPAGVSVTEERLNDRALKLELVVHAEMAAVFNAVRNYLNPEGGTLFFACTDGTAGHVWGGSPCARCAVELVAAGIAKIVTPSAKHRPSRWEASCALGQTILAEAGIEIEEIDLAPEMEDEDELGADTVLARDDGGTSEQNLGDGA